MGVYVKYRNGNVRYRNGVTCTVQEWGYMYSTGMGGAYVLTNLPVGWCLCIDLCVRGTAS